MKGKTSEQRRVPLVRSAHFLIFSQGKRRTQHEPDPLSKMTNFAERQEVRPASRQQ